MPQEAAATRGLRGGVSRAVLFPSRNGFRIGRSGPTARFPHSLTCTYVKTIRSLSSFQKLCMQAPKPVVLVPTMGALHRGHAALLRKGRRLAGPSGTLVASIFVNPAQFGPKEDLTRYPRPFARDQRLCREEEVDLLFAPQPEAMYGPDFSTWVEETVVSQPLCGASRPGHFRGVCTVVLKLFLLSQPTHAIFGKKDFQQCAVIARMVRDLNLPLQLVFEETVREPDGLALSSRNAYLQPEERAQAVVLSEALREARQAFRDRRVSTGAALRRLLQKRIASAPLARIDYLEVVDASTLQPVQKLAPGNVMALAVFFGRTRLIDNLTL
jgi:pantoate--beta-alanine ligase